MHFAEWKVLYFVLNFTEVSSQEFNGGFISIGWDSFHLMDSNVNLQVMLPTGQLDYQDVYNSSTPSDTYMRQWTRSALVQVIACCLFGAKPLPKPMLTHC